VKINSQKLASHLSGSLAPVYLVSGDEPLVVTEALDSIRARARKDGFEYRDLFVVERGFKWAELETGSDNLSLFATRRILELRLMSPRPGDEGRRVIRALIEKPDPDRVLLIATSKLDSSSAKSVWVKSIEASGVVVQVWPVGRPDLPRWIRERAGRVKLKFSTGAAELLADRVEGNLLAADQEIQKLALLLGSGDVDEKAVLDAVASSSRFDVFRLTDAILAGNLRRCIAVVDGLRTEGVEPALVSWALNRELTLLSRLAVAVAQGASETQAFSKYRIWPPQRQPLVRGALRRYRLATLIALLAQAARADDVIKGVRRGRPWDELTQLVLAMADPGKARSGRAA
jgi:DNA polymerase-3 subunit delta